MCSAPNGYAEGFVSMHGIYPYICFVLVHVLTKILVKHEDTVVQIGSNPLGRQNGNLPGF